MASRQRTVLKLLLLGDTNVGKTCILNQFVDQSFTGKYKATIGSDFTSKSLDIDGKMVSLQIWDTAGQERFQSLGPGFYRGTDCCVLVYDMTATETFDHIPRWKKECQNQLGISDSDDFPFLLLGNKSDLPNKMVQTSAAQEYAQMNGEMIFYEVSAKTADNVQTAIEAIVRKALEKSRGNEDYVIGAQVVDLEKKDNDGKGDCKC